MHQAALPLSICCSEITEKMATTGDVGHPPAVLAQRFPLLAEQLLALPDVWWHTDPTKPNCALTRKFMKRESTQQLQVRAAGGLCGLGRGLPWARRAGLANQHPCPPCLPQLPILLPALQPCVQKRVGEFKRWLLGRPEKVVVAVGHSLCWRELMKGLTGPGDAQAYMRNCELRTLHI